MLDRLLRAGAYAAMPHFTVGVVAVASDERGRLLIVQQGQRQSGKWGFPGGFVRRREDPESALRRELFEEVGVTQGAPRSSLRTSNCGLATMTSCFEWRCLPQTYPGRNHERFGPTTGSPSRTSSNSTGPRSVSTS